MSKEYPFPADFPSVSQELLAHSSAISDLERMLYQKMSEIVLAATPHTDVDSQIKQLKKYVPLDPFTQEIWNRAFQRFQQIWNAHLPQETIHDEQTKQNDQ